MTDWAEKRHAEIERLRKELRRHEDNTELVLTQRKIILSKRAEAAEARVKELEYRLHDFGIAVDSLKKRTQQRNTLQQRIDKAVEYCTPEPPMPLTVVTEDLLAILKGEA